MSLPHVANCLPGCPGHRSDQPSGRPRAGRHFRRRGRIHQQGRNARPCGRTIADRGSQRSGSLTLRKKFLVRAVSSGHSAETGGLDRSRRSLERLITMSNSRMTETTSTVQDGGLAQRVFSFKVTQLIWLLLGILEALILLRIGLKLIGAFRCCPQKRLSYKFIRLHSSHPNFFSIINVWHSRQGE